MGDGFWIVIVILVGVVCYNYAAFRYWQVAKFYKKLAEEAIDAAKEISVGYDERGKHIDEYREASQKLIRKLEAI